MFSTQQCTSTYHGVNGPRSLRRWKSIAAPVVSKQPSQLLVARESPENIGHSFVAERNVSTAHRRAQPVANTLGKPLREKKKATESIQLAIQLALHRNVTDKRLHNLPAKSVNRDVHTNSYTVFFLHVACSSSQRPTQWLLCPTLHSHAFTGTQFHRYS